MKPIYMTKSKIRQALNNIPSHEHLAMALCSLPYKQNNGIAVWDFEEAAQALCVYYRKKAERNWEKNRHCSIKYRNTRHFAHIAQAWLDKALAVEKVLMTRIAEENQNENRQAVV